MLQSAINKDRSVNIIAPNFDNAVIYARAAILATGAEKRVKIVAYNGSQEALQLIADGKSVLADVGESYFWLGWANIDQALRVLTGTKPVTDENTPLRLWDASNIKATGTPVSQTKGYGPTAVFMNGYKNLWGIG
jgi:ribose transport system substrate-binding protein